MKECCLSDFKDTMSTFLFAARTDDDADFDRFKNMARTVVLHVEMSQVYESDIEYFDGDKPVRDLPPLPNFPEE